MDTRLIDTRQKLMHGAGELILEVGFEAMTTAAVAKRAGVSEGSIYRHFASKEALAEAVFSDIWRIYNDLMEKHLPPREQPKERLDAFFRATLAALDDLMPSYGALCQQDHLHYAAKHCPEHALPDGAKEYVALIEEAIRLARDAGHVRPEVEPRVAAHFLFFGAGQAMDFFGDPHHMHKGGERLPRDVFSQLEDLMIHALYGARK
jgi:AcrR family transcriptional regulator